MADITLRQGQASPKDVALYSEQVITVKTGSGTVFTSGAAIFSATSAPLPSGGIVTSGAATPTESHVYTSAGSGTIVTSGNSAPKYIGSLAVTGGVVTGGSAFPKEISTPAVGGIGVFSGAAADMGIFSPAVSGGAVLSGSANAAKVTSISVSGGAVTSGHAADYLVSKPAAPSGSIVLSGSASVTYVPAGADVYTRTGSGIVTLSGSAPYSLQSAGGNNEGYGPVRFARSSKKQAAKAPQSATNLEKAAEAARIVPKYAPPVIPATITRVEGRVYYGFFGTAKPTQTQKKTGGPIIFAVGEAKPTRILTPVPARNSPFKGSAKVATMQAFNDDDLEAVTAWLLEAI